MGQIFITSDLHLYHNREFLYAPRGFDNIYDHNKAIVENWNKTVQVEDDVYILGDLMLNDNDGAMSLLRQLKGNIHIIRGNHDSDVRIELYKECYNVVEVVEAKFLRYGHFHFFLSHYPALTANQDDKEKGLRHMTVNLCGHSHVQDPFYDWDKGAIFHCEMDTNNCTPWLLDDIIELIKKR